jgi:hypothetical protein
MRRADKQASDKPKKTISLRTVLTWFVYLVLVAIPVVLYVAHTEVQKTFPQREAAAKAAALAARAEYDKKHPWCTQVVNYEVRDKAGALVSTDKREEQVRCAPDMEAIKAAKENAAKTERVMTIVYGTGIVLYILLMVIGGGR